MKKLLFLLIIFPFNVYSQDIQRIFLGNELGISNWEEVKTNLTKNRITYTSKIKNKEIRFTKFKQEGIIFDDCSYYFTDNNIFYMIAFCSYFKNRDEAFRYYENLKNKLNVKYELIKDTNKEYYYYDLDKYSGISVDISKQNSKNINFWIVYLTYINWDLFIEVNSSKLFEE